MDWIQALILSGLLTALDSQDLKSVLHTADEGGTTCSTDRNTELGSELSVGKGRKSPVQTQPTSAVLDSDSGAAPRCLRYRTTGTELAATPRGSGQSRSRRGRWEGGLGWGIHVNPWLIHVSVWQKPLQYCKVISLKLIKKKVGHPEIWTLHLLCPLCKCPVLPSWLLKIVFAVYVAPFFREFHKRSSQQSAHRPGSPASLPQQCLRAGGEDRGAGPWHFLGRLFSASEFLPGPLKSKVDPI